MPQDTSTVKSTAKSTVKHAAVYSLASILGKAVGFIMLPFYAHLLGVVGYGVIGMVDTALTFLMSLLSYGITGSMVRFYHEESGADKPRVISTALILISSVGALAVSLPIAFSRPLGWLLFGEHGYALYLVLGLISFFFDLSGRAAQTLLVIERRSTIFSVLGVLRLVIGLGLNIVLIVHLRWGLLGYFTASVTTSALFSAIFYFIALRKCGLAFDSRIARKIVAFELPMIPGNLLSFVSRQAEKVLVRLLVSLQGVGILEMGYRFPYLISLLVSQPFMLSWNTKRTEIAEEPDAPVELGRIFTYYLYLVFFAGLLLAANVRLLLEILTPPEFWDAYRIARIEVVSFILMGSYYHLYFGLYYAKRTKTISFIRGACSALRVGVSVAFISLWGIYGAAWSGCLMAAVQLVWVYRKGQRSYRLVLDYPRILAVCATAATIYLGLTQWRFLRLPAAQLWNVVSHDSPAAWILAGRGEKAAEIGLNGLFCLTYFLLFPAIRYRRNAALWRRIAPFLASRTRP